MHLFLDSTTAPPVIRLRLHGSSGKKTSLPEPLGTAGSSQACAPPPPPSFAEPHDAAVEPDSVCDVAEPLPSLVLWQQQVDTFTPPLSLHDADEALQLDMSPSPQPPGTDNTWKYGPDADTDAVPDAAGDHQGVSPSALAQAVTREAPVPVRAAVAIGALKVFNGLETPGSSRGSSNSSSDSSYDSPPPLSAAPSIAGGVSRVIAEAPTTATAGLVFFAFDRTPNNTTQIVPKPTFGAAPVAQSTDVWRARRERAAAFAGTLGQPSGQEQRESSLDNHSAAAPEKAHNWIDGRCPASEAVGVVSRRDERSVAKSMRRPAARLEGEAFGCGKARGFVAAPRDDYDSVIPSAFDEFDEEEGGRRKPASPSDFATDLRSLVANASRYKALSLQVVEERRTELLVRNSSTDPSPRGNAAALTRELARRMDKEWALPTPDHAAVEEILWDDEDGEDFQGISPIDAKRC